MNASSSIDAAGTTQSAKKPFGTSAIADVIIRSVDHTDFYVMQSLLRLVSPVFDTMISLPSLAEKNSGLTIVPIVTVEEDAMTLYNLLLLIYPYSQRPSFSVDICLKMAKAARKYRMDDVEVRIRELAMASSAMKREPLRIFAIALHLDWKDIMEAAARNTLAVPLRDLGWWEELEPEITKTCFGGGLGAKTP
ncbi:hypothetical protein APHAL10511_005241 [Amanita phalloides]|nr:hypothetical protein APHAL10511_005241 [Amanita phalloides]